MPKFKNYYEILDCSQDSTQDDLKRAYQSLILKHHPDKNSGNDGENNIDFHLIDKAYKVLRDVEMRKTYDAELTQTEFCERPLVFDTVHRKEFVRESSNSGDVLTRSCRCGGVYFLPEEEVSGENIFVACDECSLVIEVIYKD
ncbi:hypothetical protein DMENIID0001_091530 [Sergentomyia squamirostris]